MGSAGHTVCGHCTARVQDERQATCPHCLEPLSVRRFTSQASLEAFREDRKAHGAPVPDTEGGKRRIGVALAFAFASTLLFLAAVGITFSGVASGSWPRTLRAVTQAAVPAAIALALAMVARKYGGGSG